MAVARDVTPSGKQKRFFDVRARGNVYNCKVAGTVSQQRRLNTATVTHAYHVRRGGGARYEGFGKKETMFRFLRA